MNNSDSKPSEVRSKVPVNHAATLRRQLRAAVALVASLSALVIIQFMRLVPLVFGDSFPAGEVAIGVFAIVYIVVFVIGFAATLPAFLFGDIPLKVISILVAILYAAAYSNWI